MGIVAALIALSALSLNTLAEPEQTDADATPDDEIIGSTAREVLGWSLTPVVDTKGRVVALFGEFESDSRLGANIHLLYLERTADRNHWKLAGWPAATDRDTAASWVTARHGNECLRFHLDADAIEATRANPPAPAPLRSVLFADDPIAPDLEAHPSRLQIARALAATGYPIVPNLILMTGGLFQVKDQCAADPTPEALAIFGDDLSPEDPFTISMLANHIVWNSEPVLIRSTEHAAAR